jgi:putative tryptophan/tyrosine transport system substrate-binding protein
MKRRSFLTFAAATASLPFTAARAQQKPIPVIGYLHFSDAANAMTPLHSDFHKGLEDTGFIAGKNVTIEYRWAEGKTERSQSIAAEIVERKVDVIAAFGPPLAAAAKRATTTIPIVFEVGNDAVEAGLVASLSRPGGNATGINVLFTQLAPKLLEVIEELLPQAKTFGLLVNPASPTAGPNAKLAQEAAVAKGVRLVVLKASSPPEIDAAFASAIDMHADGLIVGADPFFGNERLQLIAQAASHKMPTIYFSSGFTEAGGLISYGANLGSVYRRMGVYVGRILRGEKPADLPVEQPTKFDLLINLKTAHALGLTVPPSLLSRANEVFE